MLSESSDVLNRVMQLTSMTWEFGVFIVILAICSFAVSWVAENHIFPSLARILGRLQPKREENRRQYKVLLEKMRSWKGSTHAICITKTILIFAPKESAWNYVKNWLYIEIAYTCKTGKAMNSPVLNIQFYKVCTFSITMLKSCHTPITNGERRVCKYAAGSYDFGHCRILPINFLSRHCNLQSLQVTQLTEGYRFGKLISGPKDVSSLAKLGRLS